MNEGISQSMYSITHIKSGTKFASVFSPSSAMKVIDYIVDEIGVSGDFLKTSELDEAKRNELKRIHEGLEQVETVKDWIELSRKKAK